MKELVKAVIAVTKEIDHIDKNTTVGEGKQSYKAVTDADVKHLVGKLMAKHGLSIFQTNIEPSIKIERWEESTNWGTKMKQSVFTEVRTTYLIVHQESGESIEVQGYGHGIDSQDKSAGKATTYALKNALLYTFLVPTASIDDTDTDHSDKKQVPQPKPQAPQKKVLVYGGKAWTQAVERGVSLDELKKHYTISKEDQEEYIKELIEKIENNGSK